MNSNQSSEFISSRLESLSALRATLGGFDFAASTRTGSRIRSTQRQPQPAASTADRKGSHGGRVLRQPSALSSSVLELDTLLGELDGLEEQRRDDSSGGRSRAGDEAKQAPVQKPRAWKMRGRITRLSLPASPIAGGGGRGGCGSGGGSGELDLDLASDLIRTNDDSFEQTGEDLDSKVGPGSGDQVGANDGDYGEESFAIIPDDEGDEGGDAGDGSEHDGGNSNDDDDDDASSGGGDSIRSIKSFAGVSKNRSVRFTTTSSALAAARKAAAALQSGEGQTNLRVSQGYRGVSGSIDEDEDVAVADRPGSFLTPQTRTSSQVGRTAIANRFALSSLFKGGKITAGDEDDSEDNEDDRSDNGEDDDGDEAKDNDDDNDRLRTVMRQSILHGLNQDQRDTFQHTKSPPRISSSRKQYHPGSPSHAQQHTTEQQQHQPQQPPRQRPGSAQRRTGSHRGPAVTMGRDTNGVLRRRSAVFQVSNETVDLLGQLFSDNMAREERVSLRLGWGKLTDIRGGEMGEM